MKPKCEQIRERAFRDGLDSPAAAEWRAHCRTCPDCRTEIFILENLERQAQEERQHLRREDVEKLLETARNHNVGRKRNLLLVWGLRAACFLALLAIGAGLLPGERAQRVRSRIESWLRGDGSVSASLGDSTEGTEIGPAPGAVAPSGPVPAAVLVPAASVQRDMRQLRRSLEDRRQSLRRLLERDFGVFGPEDAWYEAVTAIPDRA